MVSQRGFVPPIPPDPKIYALIARMHEINLRVEEMRVANEESERWTGFMIYTAEDFGECREEMGRVVVALQQLCDCGGE